MPFSCRSKNYSLCVAGEDEILLTIEPNLTIMLTKQSAREIKELLEEWDDNEG